MFLEKLSNQICAFSDKLPARATIKVFQNAFKDWARIVCAAIFCKGFCAHSRKSFQTCLCLTVLKAGDLFSSCVCRSWRREIWSL